MIDHHLNWRLDVYRRIATPDGAGGQTTVRAKVGTIRAMISQPRAVERVVAQQAGSRHDANIYVGPRADVRRGDQLRPAGAAAESRPYWDVISVVRPSRSVYRRAECELIESEEP